MKSSATIYLCQQTLSYRQLTGAPLYSLQYEPRKNAALFRGALVTTLAGLGVYSYYAERRNGVRFVVEPEISATNRKPNNFLLRNCLILGWSYARPAKVYNIQVKTHKMTIVHSGLPPTMKIADVKEETLSALRANVSQNALDVLAMDPPEIAVQTVYDFELCRAVKERGILNFEVLDASKSLRDSGITGWEAIFLQFRDRESGKLLPITYTLPPMNEDEREVPVFQDTDIRGKRRASIELDESMLDF